MPGHAKVLSESRQMPRRRRLVRYTPIFVPVHRYIIVERDPHMIRHSHNFEFPYSFSLEEAEDYLAKGL